MINKFSNPCIRCGKERVVSKTSQETVGYSVIVTTESVCPDPKCQKIVEKGNKAQRDKQEAARMKRKMRLSYPRKTKPSTKKSS